MEMGGLRIMDMATLRVIAEGFEIVGWLCFVWEMVKAAKIIASPDPDGINLILFALRRIQFALDRLSFQPGKATVLEEQPGMNARHEDDANGDGTAIDKS